MNLNYSMQYVVCSMHFVPAAYISDNNISQFVLKFNELNICEGNNEFGDVLNRRIDFMEPFPSQDGARSAVVEASKGHSKFVKEEFDTIRDVKCHYLVSGETICHPCKELKKKLYLYKSRSTDQVTPAEHTNTRYLNVEELREKVKRLQTSEQVAVRAAVRLAVTVQQAVVKEGVVVSNSQHTLFKTIVDNSNLQFDEGSPQWLLWQQQFEQSSKLSSKSMRWHPLIIRWCLRYIPCFASSLSADF